MIPQKILTENINSELSRNMSIIFIVILDQKLRPIQRSWFFDILSILQKYYFFIEIYEEFFNLCKNAKLHSDFIMAYAIRRLKA